jgi:hypothetical protein
MIKSKILKNNVKDKTSAARQIKITNVLRTKIITRCSMSNTNLVMG